MSMEAVITIFAMRLFYVGGSAFACLFTVRKSLRIPAGRAALYTALFTLAFSGISAYFVQAESPGLLGMIVLPIALGCGGVFLVKAADEKPAKVVFLLLMVGGFSYFCNTTGALAYVLFPALSEEGPVYIDIAVVGAVCAVFFPPFTFGLSRLWQKVRFIKDAPWLRLCAVSVMFILLYFFSIIMEDEGLLDFLTNGVITIFITACAFITYWQMISMLVQSFEAARHAENAAMLDGQLSLQSRRFEEIAAHMDEIRRLRHDIRHHIGVIDGMLARREYDKAAEYLSEYAAGQADADEPPLCQNLVVDVIARRYMTQAKELGIKTDFRLSLPAKIGVADTDLCIVLGNLIENGLKACAAQKSGERFLSVQCEIQENRVLADVENSFDASASSPHDAGRKGMGISSVQAIAKKYGGIAMLKQSGNVFQASVLLYLKRE